MSIFPLLKGKLYTKKDLYKHFDVPIEKQQGAWNIGYRIYEKYFFIFANIGIPGRTGHDYKNEWIGGNLHWYGQTKSHINQSQISKLISGKYDILVFTRTNDRDPFLFHGKANIISIEDSTPVKCIFSFNTIKILDSRICWEELIENANIFKSKAESIYSFDGNNIYTIRKVTPHYVSLVNSIDITKTKLLITFDLLDLFIKKISNRTTELNKTDSYNLLLVESAIIQLLPILDWDFDEKRVILNEAIFENSSTHLNEAPNDFEYRKVERNLRYRRGQNKLRNNLLIIYNNTCCISNLKIKELLHACHILPHAKTGLNISTNAILLRSDLHDLFDSHLIGIHPKKHDIHINKILNKTEYSIYNKKQLLKRLDKKPLEKNSLEFRWELFNK